MINALWARFWPYVAVVAAAFAAFFGIRQSGKSAGRAEVQRKQEQAASESRRKINETDTKLAEMDNDDVRRDLAKWVQRGGD